MTVTKKAYQKITNYEDMAREGDEYYCYAIERWVPVQLVGQRFNWINPYLRYRRPFVCMSAQSQART